MALIRNRVAPRRSDLGCRGPPESLAGAPCAAREDVRLFTASAAQSPIACAPPCPPGIGGYRHPPLHFKQPAALPLPKAQISKKEFASSSFPLPSKWVRRLPLIGVAVSVCLFLLAFLCAFSLLLSWFLNLLSDGRTSAVMHGLSLTPEVEPVGLPLAPSGRYLTVTDAQGLADQRASLTLGVGHMEMPLGAPGGSPRRLQNVVTIGAPEGAAGFEAQNMWTAFKGAPQDYLLFLWFIVNLFLVSCFCSWMCSQRSFQKAVMVSP